MDTLETNNQPIDQPASKTGLRYGLIGGLLSVALSLVMFLTGAVSFDADGGGNWLQTLLSVAVYLGVLIMAINAHKKWQGGRITFGKAFGVAAIATVVMAVLSAIFTYVYFSFIDPEVLNIAYEKALEQVESQGQDPEQVAGILKSTISAPAMAIYSLLGGVILGMIVSLILALIQKNA